MANTIIVAMFKVSYSVISVLVSTNGQNVSSASVFHEEYIREVFNQRRKVKVNNYVK